MRRRNRGFTLVELSIVLVIIGLLIGGILVAQSMISSANIVATIKQIQQFDAGVEAFKSKYGFLPGDAPQFSAGVANGNGDGYITGGQGANCCSSGVNIYGGEIANFWNQFNPTLYAGTSSGSGMPPVVSGAGTNVPLSKMGSSGSFFIASALGQWPGPQSADTTSSLKGNYYAIVPLLSINTSMTSGSYYQLFPSNSAGAQSAGYSVKPADLLALDQKIDDGIANTGNVIAGINDGGGGVGNGYIVPRPIAACASGATYTVTSSGYQCVPLIRIGGAAGDPQ